MTADANTAAEYTAVMAAVHNLMLKAGPKAAVLLQGAAGLVCTAYAADTNTADVDDMVAEIIDRVTTAADGLDVDDGASLAPVVPLAAVGAVDGRLDGVHDGDD